MTFEEFKTRTTDKASHEIFERFNRMYMAGEMDKDYFCRMVKSRVIAESEVEPIQGDLYLADQGLSAAIRELNACYKGDEATFLEALGKVERYGLEVARLRQLIKKIMERE